MNVLRSVVLVLAWLVAAPGWCQIADGERLAVPVRPEARQAWIANVVWERTVTRQGKTLVDIGGRILASIEVTDVSDNGYDIIWTTRSASEIADHLEPGFIDPHLTVGIPIAVRLDASGTLLELKEWDRVREELVRNFARREPGWAKLDYFETMVNEWDESASAGFVLTSMPAIAVCQGLEVVAGPPMRVDEYVWNPLDGSEIEATVTYELHEVDRKGGVARIGLEREIDPEAAMEWARNYLNNLAEKLGAKPNEFVDRLASFKLINNLSAKCTVDLSTGLTKAVDHSLDVAVGYETAREVRQITLQPIAGSR